MTDNLTRWRGYSHEELYRMVHEGPGAPSSAAPSRRWAELTAALDEVGHQLETALGSAGSGWTGRAAGAAYDRLMPLAAWAKTTSEGAASMRVAVETQGDHIARARADMPVPEGVTPMAPDPTLPPAVQVVGAQTDAEPAETAKAAGEQRAVEVMTTYETNTKQNLGALTPFPTPAEVLRDGSVRRGRGLGVELGTQASSAVDVRPGNRHGVEHAPGLREHGQHGPPHGPTAGSSAAPVELVRQRPTLAPGALAASGPMESFGGSGGPVALGAPRESDRVRERRLPGATAGVGVPVDGPSSGALGSTAGAVPPGAPPPHGAGAPMGGAAGPVGSADKMAAARRFGPEAIGSTQWFADADAPAPRVVSGRNRDLGSTEQVTENVSVDGEDHLLPPPVIGG